MASGWTSICRFLFRRSVVERELDAELQYHVDRQTELNLSRGMAPAEARRQALLSIGGVEPLKDECREARVGHAIDTFLQDIRYGMRVLRKNRGYALATIVTLALGIGANTAIFSLVYGVFLRPLPYRQGGELVVLHQKAPQRRQGEIGFSPAEIADYADRNHTLTGVVEHHSMSFLLYGKESAERVSTSVVSVNFFEVLGVTPLLGRTFLPNDNNPSSGAVLVLSHQYWQGRQHGDPNIVGKVFQMNGMPHTVIGVLPPIPQYPVESEVYMPTWQCPSRSDPDNIRDREYRLISHVFGRLKPGVTIQQAQADLSVIARQMAKAYPADYPPDSGFAVAADPLRYDLTYRAHTALLVLLGVAAFVLLVACANVANMMLARLLKLEKELALRSALGAGKSRLVRQLLTESVLLSSAGGALGLALAPVTLNMLSRFAANFTPRAREVQIDGPVLLFTLLVSVATGLLFGLIPAMTPWKAAGELLHGARTTASRRRQTLRSALVVAQVAFSFVLLIGAGLMLRSFQKLTKANPGFDPSHLLSLRITGGIRYDLAGLRTLQDNLKRRVGALAGVASVTWSSAAPFSPAAVQNGPMGRQFEIEGRPAFKASAAPIVAVNFVDADYFQTLRQPLLQGRSLTDRDDQTNSPPVLVINESMARHHWPGEDPVGRRITLDNKRWWTIVGVVGDARPYGLDRPVSDEIYAPPGDIGFRGRLVVRTELDPNTMLGLVSAAIRAEDPLVAIDDAGSVASHQYESLASPRLMTILLSLFAGLAVLISAAGIAAVMALSVSQRTHELGVRLALGAQHGSIVTMVIRQGLGLAVVGTLIGMAGAYGLSRLLVSLLYATSPTDALTYAAVCVVFLLVACLACYFPARQVTSIDPLNALRQE